MLSQPQHNTSRMSAQSNDAVWQTSLSSVMPVPELGSGSSSISQEEIQVGLSRACTDRQPGPCSSFWTRRHLMCSLDMVLQRRKVLARSNVPSSWAKLACVGKPARPWLEHLGQPRDCLTRRRGETDQRWLAICSWAVCLGVVNLLGSQCHTAALCGGIAEVGGRSTGADICGLAGVGCALI